MLLNFVPEASSPIFTYQTGQYLNVTGPNHTIFPLSIANTAEQHHADNIITVYLRAGVQHPIAENFLNQIKKEQGIRFTGPAGHCIVKPADYYYFIAGGTGFSPIQALLSAILPLAKPCLLYWGIQNQDDLYHHPLLENWKKTYPHFSYTPVLSQKDTAWSGKTGWVHTLFFEEQNKVLMQHLIQHQSYYVYASGPYPMIQALKEGFISHNLPLDALLSDMLPELFIKK